MKYRAICCIALLLLLTSCNKHSDGVAYPEISENRFKYVRNSTAQVLWADLLLDYGGRTYTGILSEQDDLTSDMICGEKLGTVYGYDGALWSDNEAKIAAVDTEAEIYSVKGYDTDFRVCVYVKESNALLLFENLNGITARRGAEIFKDKLKLDEYEKVERIGTDRSAEQVLDADSFLKKIFAAELVSPDEQGVPQNGAECSYELVFYGKTGMADILKVYDDGYVIYEAWGGGSTYRFIVKIE